MNFKKNFLLILTLVVLFAPFVVDSIVLTNIENSLMAKSHNGDSLQRCSDQTISFVEEESRLFLENVDNRLNSGEDDPDTPTRVFVHWSDRQPDFPEWVKIDKVFDLIPVVEVTCALKDVPRLSEEINHVTYITSVDEGVLASISGFTQAYDPYIGEYPLLLNETRSLVNAADTNTTGTEVIVAILSTGINDTHPMLDDMDDNELTENDPKVIASYDAHFDETGADDDETDDDNGRGTALASIVAGTAVVGGKLETSVDFSYPFPYGTDQDYEQEINAWINIGTQMGLAPEAYLFDVKITDDAGSTYDEGAIINGIEWSVEHGADVILLDDISDIILGSTIMRAIEAATSLGSLIIVPAGDFEEIEDYDDKYIAPYYTILSSASEVTALTVGATTETNSLWVKSERGPVLLFELSKPDVVAPGVHMLGANTKFADNEANNPGGWEGGGDAEEMLYYDVFSSTSVAAAVAAGASARLIEAYPGASPTAIKIALRQGATDLGFNEMAQGKGIINLAGAMNILQNAPKKTNNWVGHRHYTYSSPFTATYQDFEGIEILFDGSWTDDSLGGTVDHEWSDLTNGNLTALGVSSNWQHPYNDTLIAAPVSLDTLDGIWQHPYDDTPVGAPVILETLGVPGWQHPYNDSVQGYYWYNVSYPLAETLTVKLDNLTIRTGDNFTVYQSDIPNDPDPTDDSLIAMTFGNISSTQNYQTLVDYNNLYFVFGSDGDGAATDPIFGMYGSIFQPGSTWCNVSYPLAERLTVSMDTLNLEIGDSLNVYQSDIPNDPNPATSLISTSSNISSTTDYITNLDYYNLYFEFISDGDGVATNSIFGMYGSIFQHGSTWWNVSFPGATTVTVEIDTLTIADGDSFTVYQSDIPNDPDPTDDSLIATTFSNISIAQNDSSFADYNNLYFKFTGNGDGATTNNPDLWGMYGSIYLGFFASETGLDLSNSEFTELASELDDMGATIEYWCPEDAEAPPSATLLEYYDVYVLGQPLAKSYSGTFNLPTEEAYYEWLSGNLTTYLNAGGRVLFIGDEEHCYYNYATNALGVTWNQGGGGGPTTDFTNHELLTTPFIIEELLIDAPYTYFSGSANTLVQESGKQTIVYYDENNGKAVFVADEDVFNDELWDEPFSLTPDRYNNSQFALNIFYWFTGITYQSGEQSPYDNHFKIVSYSCPQVMIDGDQWELDVVVQNIGNYTSQAWIAFGLDHTPDGWVNLGDGAFGNDPASGNDGIFDVAGDDNANDSWAVQPDYDIGTSLNNTTIEFYYNISEDYPINQIAFPLIVLEATGMDRQTDECYLSLNGIQIGPIYETNTTAVGGPGESGESWYPIFPMSTLMQYNNRVEITVPESVNLTLDSFQIVGYNFTNSLGNISHVVTPALAPNEEYTASYQYTPSGLSTPTYFTPRVQVYPYNTTYAYISPGYVTPDVIYNNIQVDYGLHTSGYYWEPNLDVYAINKIARRGDLPLLYDITPGSFDLSSSVKIARFPGDIRVDGLTVMSSAIVDQPNLRLSGGISSVVGLGNFTESLGGLGQYSTYAPDYFYINDTWTATNRLNLDYLNHSSSGPILQTDIPPTQTPGTITGTLSLYSNDTALYSINLQLDITNPSGSFLLYDTDAVDTINFDRNYDKLWDQVFEMWYIAASAGYDIDSLYQEWYLFEHRSHIDLANDDTEYFADYVCNVPAEEELPYSGILTVSMDTTDVDPADNFLARGGSLIQFGTDFHLGPNFSPDISYVDSEITTLVDGSGSTNPLLNGIDQLFCFGGDYMLVAQDTYDLQQNYDAISGQNWLYTATVDKPNNDFAVIYHDAIYPQRFGYDAGKYLTSTNDFGQTYMGLKIIVASENLGHSWFLEQPDYWAYASMQYAASQNILNDTFDVNPGNRLFIENIFKTAANRAPEIESINISPEHVSIGDNITISVTISDESTSSLTVAVPEKLTSNNLKYAELVYDSSSGAFVGSFPVISANLINNWNIYIIDDLYRVTVANDAYSQFLPKINVLPTAWTTDQMDTYPYSHLTSIDKGEMITLTVYYMDAEDGTAIFCNVSLVHYKNSNETEVIHSKLFSGGSGRGLFFIDTTGLSSGTHIAVATVTDTDGGTASYEVAGFNIGSGTLYKEPSKGGVDLAPVVGGAAVVTIVAGAAGGSLFFYLRRTGKSLGELFGRGGD